MSNIKELIRAEIERRKNKWLAASRLVKKGKDTAMYAAGKSSAYTELLSFLDTLPDESEQPTRGYDEAYLNEKIAKASKSWKGVDVDKFMDEIRGREPVTDCHDLTDAAEKSARQYYVDGGYSPFPNTETASHIAGFKSGAEWKKAKMMEGAVVARVEADLDSHGADYGIRYIHIRMPDDSPIGDKVRIIILPKED